MEGKHLKDISKLEWRGYISHIFESRKNLCLHQKAQFFCIRLAKTSPEFFKGWDYNTARIYDNQNCNWSLIWSEANRFLGAHWEIKEKQLLGPDPSLKNKPKKKVAIADKVEVQQSRGGMYVISTKDVKHQKQDNEVVFQQLCERKYYTYITIGTDFVTDSGNEGDNYV